MRRVWRTMGCAVVLSCAAPGAAAPPPGPAGTARYAGLFARLGCQECHAVSALEVRAQRDVAPDLTTAYADVVTRYGVNLETFLANPSGVMRLLLVAHLQLTQADRDSLVHVLRWLHQQRRADALDAPAPAAGRRPDTHAVATRTAHDQEDP